jgi:hypothetical protein
VSSFEQDCYGRELDAGEECAGKLIVAGRYSSELFQIIEESFDQVALSIKGEIGGALRDPICLGRDDRRDAAFLQRLDQGIRIISFVGQESFRFDLFEKRFRHTDVGSLAWRQCDRNRIAQGVDERMDFCG